MKAMRWFILVSLLLVAAAGCQIVPGTGDSSTDAAAAQQFVPQNIPGYIAVDATSITDALSKAGVAGSVLSGNVPAAGAIAKIDDMIRCYQGVGAVAAKVYTEANIAGAISGVPKIGAIAVVNTTRLQRNLLQCVLNTGGASAQAANEIQPCGSSGQITVNGENIQYVFAATTPELCTVFQAEFNQ